ncbi:MAG: LamG domain-containing protein, partial [Opitutae bacterium]
VGGSGGARSGGRNADGGGGGGALSLVVGGSFILEENATISANGGKGLSSTSASGAGGSGGSIRIEAANISNSGKIEALGGDANGSGGPGGGGRISFITPGSLEEGNFSVSAGSNLGLAYDLLASAGIFSKIISPSLPSLPDHNFTFENLVSSIDIGLASGLSYELFGLPEGIYLSDELKLAGTPTRAGTFSVMIKASNRFGETNDTFDIHVASGNPSLSTLPASEVGATAALLHAQILSTGGEDVGLSFIYGTSDDNLNMTTSSSTISGSGKFSILLTGLESNETYFFRAQVENSQKFFESNDSDDQNFTTLLKEVPPTVTIGTASQVTDKNATISYELISYDSTPPHLTLFWGPIDHEKIDGLWESSYDLGQVSEIGSGNFVITGRKPGETIFYRVRAATDNLSSWSQTSGSFTTVAKPEIIALPVSEQTLSSVNIRGLISSIGGVDKKVTLEKPKVNQNLRAYWNFDEGQGYETFDKVGNSGVAWLRGGVTWQPSHSSDFGTAVSLEGNEFAYIELGAEQNHGVTQQDYLLGWFQFDEETGITANNLGSQGSSATLLNGATFSTDEKKFGLSSLHIPASNQSSYARIDSPIEVGPNDQSNNYSLSAWFKGLYNHTENDQGWRTLTRGSGANHHILIYNNGDEIGTHSGWVSSGYNLPPSASANSWQHLAATFNGSSTQVYIDGSWVGNINASEGNNIYAIGNAQWGTQRFARYLDDFRVYGITLEDEDVASIYNAGNGDYPDANDSLLLGGEMTLSAWIKQRKYEEGTRPFDFGNHSGTNAFNLLRLSSMDNDGNLTTGDGIKNMSSVSTNLWKLNQWQHICITVEEDGATSFFSNNEFLNSSSGHIIPKLKRTHHILGGNRIGTESFEVLQVPGLTLWLDAADTSTIVIDSGNEVST